MLEAIELAAVTHVEEPLTDCRPNATVDGGLRHHGRLEVHVEKVNGSRSEHLGDCEARAPVDVLVPEACLSGEDPIVKPLLELQVAPITTKERHRCMGVPVYQPGCDRHSAGIDYVASPVRIDRPTNP